MSEQQTTTPGGTTGNPAGTTVGMNTNTGSQTAATTAANQEDDTTERSTANCTDTHKDRNNESEKFRGSIEEMTGQVFQMPQEGRKPNQFRTTINKLKEFVSVEMEQGMDLQSLFDSPMTEPTLDEPPDEPPGVAFDDDENVTVRASRDHRKYISWKAACERHDSRVDQMRRNKGKLFAVIVGQCSEAVSSKLMSLDEFKDGEARSDCLWLLTNVKAICNLFEESTNRYLALIRAKKSVWNLKQKGDQGVTEYYEELRELIDVVESYNGVIHDAAEAAPDSEAVLQLCQDERQTHMRERTCAMLLIDNADKKRFGKLQADLANDFQKGDDKYPTEMVKAYNLLLSYKDPDEHSGSNNQNGNGRPGRRAVRGQGFLQLGVTFLMMGLALATSTPRYSTQISSGPARLNHTWWLGDDTAALSDAGQPPILALSPNERETQP